MSIYVISKNEGSSTQDCNKNSEPCLSPNELLTEPRELIEVKFHFEINNSYTLSCQAGSLLRNGLKYNLAILNRLWQNYQFKNIKVE